MSLAAQPQEFGQGAAAGSIMPPFKAPPTRASAPQPLARLASGIATTTLMPSSVVVEPLGMRVFSTLASQTLPVQRPPFSPSGYPKPPPTTLGITMPVAGTASIKMPPPPPPSAPIVISGGKAPNATRIRRKTTEKPAWTNQSKDKIHKTRPR